MSAHCSLQTLFTCSNPLTDQPTDGSNISLYYSNISISMLPENVVSCQAHKRTHTHTHTQQPDSLTASQDYHPPQNKY